MRPLLMKQRFLSGVALAVLAGLCVWGGVLPTALGVIALSTLCLSEFYQLMNLRPLVRGLGYVCNTAFLVLIVFSLSGSPWFGREAARPFLWIPPAALFFFHFFGHFIGESENREESLRYQSGAVLIGFVWISLALACSIIVRARSRGAQWLFVGIAASAACDTAAYAIGKKFGRRRLAPRISPGKTLEGTLGGIAFSILSTLILGWRLSLSRGNLLFLGLILAAAAVAGDLIESAWKRKVGVKDAGSLLAGHGGFLDRLDSHLLAIPALFLYLLL